MALSSLFVVGNSRACCGSGRPAPAEPRQPLQCVHPAQRGGTPNRRWPCTRCCAAAQPRRLLFVAVCFLLPFATASCTSRVRTASVTTPVPNLVTGGHPHLDVSDKVRQQYTSVPPGYADQQIPPVPVQPLLVAPSGSPPPASSYVDSSGRGRGRSPRPVPRWSRRSFSAVAR